MERIIPWLSEASPDETSETNKRLSYVAKTFDPELFEGVECLFMCFYKYCYKLYIRPSKLVLQAYLNIDAKRDIYKYNIKLPSMESYDYTQSVMLTQSVDIITKEALILYDNYINQDLSEREFVVDLYDFMSTKKSSSLEEALLNTYSNMMTGKDLNEISTKLQAKISRIQRIYNTDSIKDLTMNSSSTDDRDKMEYIADTGIPCIDGDLGGIYTKLIITINAQPESGKTRLVLCYFMYPILLAGYDTIFYETELSKSQTMNILIAHHIVNMFDGKYKIPDSKMNKKDGLDEREKQIYEAAKIDLFESGKYGTFYFKEECIVEDYEDEVYDIMRISGKVRAISIDYMGFIKSKPKDKYARPMEQYQVITEGYEATRRILKNSSACAVCINQFNDKGIDAANNGKPIRSGYVQGGHIAMRHTDYDISMTYTEEQKLAGKRMLENSKKRGTEGFKPTLLSTDLAVSVFTQEEYD